MSLSQIYDDFMIIYDKYSDDIFKFKATTIVHLLFFFFKQRPEVWFDKLVLLLTDNLIFIGAKIRLHHQLQNHPFPVEINDRMRNLRRSDP